MTHVEKSLLFYDIETTGTNPVFDQPVEFASIRTDMQLREIERRHFLITMRWDVVPAPGAFLTHRILPSRLMREGVSEYEAACRIHDEFNRPGTISLGYNSMSFDDNFVRFLFYRNLLPVYTHQYAQGCGRADLLPITALFAALSPQSLEHWPEHEGRRRLKLDMLGRANQLAEGTAHQAMVDVEATLELARRFAADPHRWQFALESFDRQVDRSRIDSMPAGPGGLPLSIAYDARAGCQRNFSQPCLLLGESHAYRGQQLWLPVDRALAEDSVAPVLVDPETALTRILRRRAGEPPIMLPAQQRFVQAFPEQLQFDLQQASGLIQASPDWLSELRSRAQAFRWPHVDDLDLDARLYVRDFPSDEQQREHARFHRAQMLDKPAILPELGDAEDREMATRLLLRNLDPGVLPPEFGWYAALLLDQIAPQDLNAPRTRDFRGRPRPRALDALQQIEEILEQQPLDAADMRILRELQQHLRNMIQ